MDPLRKLLGQWGLDECLSCLEGGRMLRGNPTRGMELFRPLFSLTMPGSDVITGRLVWDLVPQGHR